VDRPDRSMYFTVGEIRVDKREDASISCNYFGYYKQTVKEATRTDEKGELQALKRSVEETKKRSSFQRGWRRCRDSHRRERERERERKIKFRNSKRAGRVASEDVRENSLCLIYRTC